MKGWTNRAWQMVKNSAIDPEASHNRLMAIGEYILSRYLRTGRKFVMFGGPWSNSWKIVECV